MNINEKLEALKASMVKQDAVKAFLTENKISFWENVKVGNKGIVLPIYIPRYRIAVNIGDDEAWFKAVKYYTHPIIIRESDTPEFVLEKLRNTISRHMERVREARERDKKPLNSYRKKMIRRTRQHRDEFQAMLRAESKKEFPKKRKRIVSVRAVRLDQDSKTIPR